ncbi:ABC transporter substrate-binding protein [Thermanaerothrix sp.]|uniref:ABC transporter substrate-binding protein n=1 Tax=Thermanaerothrix sp. TaxID=2972675 RepID=UPI002ADDA546|nr:ABC transporter substrate-binding protein [Thermanaerothrix sp.]
MKKWMAFFLLVLFFLSACAPTKPAEIVTIRVALLPILDGLPIVVAQQEGLFEKHNVKVEILPVSSGPERDQMVAAGQADAMVNELTSVMFFNKETPQVQAVRFARTATADQALFRVLAAKGANIKQVADLKGVPVGVSQATVIEYLTQRLLEVQGFQPDEIQTISVPKIPDRMALLASGELKAAMLPEPFATLAEQQGALPLFDDTLAPEYSFSMISVRKALIDQHPQAVKAFLMAIEEAVQHINADPQKYSGLMVEQKMVPAPLAESFRVPIYPLKGVPTETQFADALAWAKAKGYLDKDLAYSDCVNPNFLP